MFAGSDHSYLGRLQLLTVAAPHIFDDEQRDLLVKAGYQSMDCPIFFHIESYLSTQPRPLLKLLWELRHQKCTVPHDRIYAILSMHRHPEINIDYTIPAWKIFRDLTIQFITESHSLQALTVCMPSENIIPDCPSWVPDWSIDFENRSLQEITNWYSESGQTAIEQATSFNRPRFCASGNRNVEVVSLTERKMTARGVLLTIVTERVPSWSDMLSFLTQDLSKGEIQSTPPSIDPAGAESNPHWGVVAATYVRICRQAAMNANSDVDAAVIARTLYAGISQFAFAPSDRLEGIERVALRLCDGKAQDLVDDVDFELARYFYVSVRAACTKRRFCTGVNGKPILGPENTKIGDHVVLLFGSPVPLILRPVDPEQPQLFQYTLLGECYVDGIMHGEVLEQIETGVWDRNILNFQLE
jgi:hypothetical protein